MFNSNFDPYEALMNLNANIQNLITAHNGLAKKVEEQGHVIDLLIDGLNSSNKANEVLMQNMANEITEKLKEVK
jgi:hypothetical protein